MPGIELSCEAEKHEIHILGYDIDINDKKLLGTLEHLRKGRRQRNLSMIRRFQEDGIPITLEKLLHGNEHTVITRAHFARVLIEEGYCSNKDQAFKILYSQTLLCPRGCSPADHGCRRSGSARPSFPVSFF